VHAHYIPVQRQAKPWADGGGSGRYYACHVLVGLRHSDLANILVEPVGFTTRTANKHWRQLNFSITVFNSHSGLVFLRRTYLNQSAKKQQQHISSDKIFTKFSHIVKGNVCQYVNVSC